MREKKKVVRMDRSPMNRKVWVIQLSCGHDIVAYRKPRYKEAHCDKCEK